MAKPNFLIIMSDEHDPRVSSPYGHPFIETPAIQRLADTGATFESAYCNSPLCVPSRASFMTGKYVHHIGVWDNGVPLASDEPTWAHRLNAAGYDSALAGKMHFVGTDQRHGFTSRLVADVHGLALNAPPDWSSAITSDRLAMRKRFAEAGAGDSDYQRYDEVVAAQSCAFLSEAARHERPWALCTSFITPHFPLIARQPYFDRYFPTHADLPASMPGHLERQHPQNIRLRRYFATEGLEDEAIARARAAYYALITFCDAQVAKVVAALDRHGLTENTLIAYVSDHGEMHGEHGMWWKCTFYEASARIPFILSWPNHIAPGTRFQTITSLVDLVATMCGIAGAEMSELDGANLAPLLAGEALDGGGVAFSEYEAHGTTTPARMVRQGRYKLNYYFGESPELFDIESDPDEFRDLAGEAEYAPVRDELIEMALHTWDPRAIDRRVRESQHRRLIIQRGTAKTKSPVWT
jgi:choline-sulfatase